MGWGSGQATSLAPGLSAFKMNCVMENLVFLSKQVPKDDILHLRFVLHQFYARVCSW